jgi:hypothetical protein
MRYAYAEVFTALDEGPDMFRLGTIATIDMATLSWTASTGLLSIKSSSVGRG